MKLSSKALIAITAASTLLAGVSAANASVVFSDTSGSNVTFRGADRDPLTYIGSVSTTTTITSFEIENQMVSAGNLEFLIFNDNGTLLYNSGAIAYGSDPGMTWKTSPTLSFTLVAGQTYDFGTVADVSANYIYGVGGNVTQNGITSVQSNQNAGPFNSPELQGHAGATIPLILNGGIPAVPEPSQTASLGLGMFALCGLMLRARTRKSIA